MELYKMRLAIEKSILAEELKILLHDRQEPIQQNFTILQKFICLIYYVLPCNENLNYVVCI
jgi:hypothetical protein